MKICKTKIEVIDFLFSKKTESLRIGFIPTMGALHEGHLSLISKSKQENDISICSIFVNPTQFNDPSDLIKYPRPIENDIKLLEIAGCDMLFLPEVNEMYLENESWSHSFGELENIWEGAIRPGHFKGVGQIVLKLFQLINPTNAYFGQKDFQQTLIVKRLVNAFSLPINVVVCPILRENGGLAMSSRNIRLTDLERQNANQLVKVLMHCRHSFLQKESLSAIKKTAIDSLKLIENGSLEYFEIVDQYEMEAFNAELHSQAPLAILAIRFNGTRLIDNMILEK